jgi:hypothetical protein
MKVAETVSSSFSTAGAVHYSQRYPTGLGLAVTWTTRHRFTAKGCARHRVWTRPCIDAPANCEAAVDALAWVRNCTG